MGRNERTLQMMKNFVKHHNEGMGIPEIAAKYDLSTQTAYSYLDEIAANAGVTRESLLEVPHFKQHFPLHSFKPVKPVDMKGFNQHFEATVAEMEAVRGEVKKTIKTQEKFSEKVLGEEEKWKLGR